MGGTLGERAAVRPKLSRDKHDVSHGLHDLGALIACDGLKFDDAPVGPRLR